MRAIARLLSPAVVLAAAMPAVAFLQAHGDASGPYKLSLDSMSARPILSVANPVGAGHSPCNFTFNPAWVPGASPPGMFVRAAQCPEGWGGSDDKILFAPCSIDGECEAPWPASRLSFPPGSEDPRVVFDEASGSWINFWYQPGTSPSCTGAQCTVALGFSKDPLNATSWSAIDPIRLPWHRNGCLLLRKSPPHYAIFGEGPGPLPGIGIASTSDLQSYSTINSTWLMPLGAAQNEIKLEAATPPVQLSTGDYLFFYAAATPGWVANGNYTAGALILDGNDPTVIKQRVPHFLVPLLPYQQGVPPYPVNRHRVIFLPSVVPLEGRPDTFRLFFGAADASIGMATVSVARASEQT